MKPWVCLVVCAGALITGCGATSNNGQAVEPQVSAAVNEQASAQLLLSDEEREQTQLAELAKMLRIKNPPQVETVRRVRPDERWSLIGECLSTEGFPQSSTKMFTWGPGQKEQYDLAFYTCSARYPLLPVFSHPPTEAQFRVYYQYYLSETIPCLEKAGYTVSDVPSLESYLESVKNGKPWMPVPAGQGASEGGTPADCSYSPPPQLLYPDQYPNG